jgi:hypothetical protein
MRRRRYRNGDAIALPGGCDGCDPSRINGVLCHETGCPYAWKDRAVECSECGCDFYREQQHQRVCPDCSRAAEEWEGEEIEEEEDDVLPRVGWTVQSG